MSYINYVPTNFLSPQYVQVFDQPEQCVMIFMPNHITLALFNSFTTPTQSILYHPPHIYDL